MERHTFVSVWGHEETEKARAIAQRLDIAVPARSERSNKLLKATGFNSALHLKLEEGTATRYIESLERSGIEPKLAYDAIYSRDDVLNAPLIDVCYSMSRDDVEVDPEARYAGASGGCERCRSLCELQGPIIFKRGPQRGVHIVKTWTNDWLVSEHLAGTLRSVPGVGQHLVPLQGEALWKGWERLVVESTLPRFDPSTTGYVTENQCPTCKRDGYGSDNTDCVPVLRYSTSTLRTAGPINGTYELIARTRQEDGRLISRATPMLLVNPEVARILLDEAPDDVDLTPVEAV